MGLRDGLRPVAGAELAEEAALQVLHRLDGDPERTSRLLHRLPALDRSEDVTLPPREGYRRPVVEADPCRLDDGASVSGTEQRAAARHDVDGVQHVGGLAVEMHNGVGAAE